MARCLCIRLICPVPLTPESPVGLWPDPLQVTPQHHGRDRGTVQVRILLTLTRGRQKVAVASLHSSRPPFPPDPQMRIQWDPYTGQFIDIGKATHVAPLPSAFQPLSTHWAPTHQLPSPHLTRKGDDAPAEMGVPSRTPTQAATGLKPSELKVGAGSVAKASAYLATKMVRAGGRRRSRG